MRRPALSFLAALWVSLVLFQTGRQFLLPLLIALAVAVLTRKVVCERLLQRSVPANSAVLITGCSTGFGKWFALDLSARGLLVFAGVRRVEDGEALVAAADEQHRARIVPVILDVTKEDHIAAAVTAVRSRLGAENKRLFAVVNNAGVHMLGAIETLPIKKIKSGFDVNVFGAVAVSQAFLPLLREFKGRGGARLVFIGSYAGLTCLPYMGAYCASKHALEAVTDAFRQEVSHWGIRVTVLEPGSFKTEIVDAFDEHLDDSERKASLPEPGVFAPAPVRRHYAREMAAFSGFTVRNKHLFPAPGAVADLLRRTLLGVFPPARATIGLDAQFGLVAHLLPDAVLDRALKLMQLL